MNYVETVALGRTVFLPVQKETKTYYETRQYVSLGIVGKTMNDQRLNIVRWHKNTTTVKKLSEGAKAQINVMD